MESPAPAAPAEPDGLSHASEAIHQEISFSAERGRVYAVLTRAEPFDAVTRLSEAAALLASPGAKPTAIRPEVGGAFTLFGGYVTGCNLELLEDERLVQAWRAASWPAGDFSIVQFSLRPAGGGTRLIFDHRGFPQGQGAHLAAGWHINYWKPMNRYLSRG
jgi:activator of HSP90 ATPase